MNNAVQDLAGESQAGTRNTGFPEPLSTERNTTLPHPDANTGPHASIEASDIPLNRTSSRLRFHKSQSKRHTSSGSIPIAASLLVGPEHLYQNRAAYHAENADSPSTQNSVNQDSGYGTREGWSAGKESSPESDRNRSFECGGSAEGLSRGDSVTGSQKKRRNFLRKLRKH